MMKRKNWKVWCVTEGKYVHINKRHAEAAPTVCPTDGGHTITAGLTALDAEEMGEENETTSDPGVNDDFSAGYVIGSKWYNTSSNKEFVCVDDTNGAAVWTETTQTPGGGSSYSQTFALGDANTAYIQTTSQSYAVLSKFIFPGTDFATPAICKAICHLGGGTDMDLRLYDATNAQVICEKIDITESVSTLHDLGTISNLPSGPAIFEIQALGTGSGPKARVSSLILTV